MKSNSNIKTPTNKTPNGKPEQLFPSKKSAASYLHNDVQFTAQVKSTKRDVEVTEDNEETKIPSGDQVARRAERKAVKIDKAPKAGTDQVTENVKKIDKNKSTQEMQFIINPLTTGWPLQWPPVVKGAVIHAFCLESYIVGSENIVSRMFYCELESSEYIFKQGDDASSFFIIAKGKVEVLIHEQVRREMSVGEGFGELALMYNAPRSASIRAVETCGFWGIERASFKKALEEMITKEYEENRMFINLLVTGRPL